MKTLTLTYPRDQLPLALEGRVPLAIWQHTYDQLLASYQEEAELLTGVSKWTRFALIPCLLPCIFPFLFGAAIITNKATKDHEQEFLHFIHREAAIYRSYGVEVTPAKELVSYGAGSDRRMRNKVVGLHFDVVGSVVVGSYSPPTLVQPTVEDTATRAPTQFLPPGQTVALVY
jgi:hypothetical protein